jgi:hypothetical protein
MEMKLGWIFILVHKTGFGCLFYNPLSWGKRHNNTNQLNRTHKNSRTKKVGSGMSSPTKHNQSVLPARSRLLELGYQQPQQGSPDEFRDAVAQIAKSVLDALSSDGQRTMQAIQPTTDAMIHHTPNHLPQQWSSALLVVSCPEYFFEDAGTIQRVNDEVIRQATRLFRRYGLSSDAIQAGFQRASSEMAEASTR